MSYQTSSKRSPLFWLLIGARKLLCFSAQSQASRPMGRFVYPYTEWYMNGSCSPCLSGPYAEALLEMKSSNLSTKFKAFPSDFTRESHRWIRWTFRRYRNSSVFKSLRVFQNTPQFTDVLFGFLWTISTLMFCLDFLHHLLWLKLC